MREVMNGEYEQVILTNPKISGSDWDYWDYNVEYAPLEKPIEKGEEVWVVKSREGRMCHYKTVFEGRYNDFFFLVRLEDPIFYHNTEVPLALDVVRCISRKKPAIVLKQNDIGLIVKYYLKGSVHDVIFED